MNTPQPGILAPALEHGRFIEFSMLPGRDPGPVLEALATMELGEQFVMGLGPALIQGLGHSPAPLPSSLRSFPDMAGPRCAVPSTQRDIWCWVRGDDRGRNVHGARAVARALAPAFQPVSVVDGFTHRGGRDLSGYVDGTGNPVAEAAVAAAIAEDGSSFVAVQQWRHDLDQFDRLEQSVRDDIIGRRLSDNVEFEGAPPSAHVKRTAQESFAPEAFILRRSLPWADATGEGLMFVAFGHSLDAFEVQLRRMCGLDDGITDGLFRFTQPLTGSYFWCPPTVGGCLDLRTIGI